MKKNSALFLESSSPCSCFRHLGKGKAGAPANPPPLAICNNFAVLPLPEEIASFVPTWAELSVCALSQVACLYTVNGRNRQKFLSHSLVFLNHQPAATALPRALTSNESYIIFANLNTNEQKVAKRKHHLVRENVTDAGTPVPKKAAIAFMATTTS